ncbi:uncharacterized protein LOC105839726 [Monomorium pharaonis]|uniref:uncharacterized protein LOC105839726 n=1 Tax=Monomorium pharaonis TaxID=307658 RepID=UPI00102E12EB|nr:uncharacterized protein LOC105839726 [Monomorium pharaonis]
MHAGSCIRAIIVKLPDGHASETTTVFSWALLFSASKFERVCFLSRARYPVRDSTARNIRSGCERDRRPPRFHVDERALTEHDFAHCRHGIYGCVEDGRTTNDTTRTLYYTSSPGVCGPFSEYSLSHSPSVEDVAMAFGF